MANAHSSSRSTDVPISQELNRHNPLIILAVCFSLAFAFAVTFVCVLTLSLPASDGAAGSAPFSDPLVFPIMSVAASISALIVFPFTYFALRDRPLGKSMGILSAIVFLELVLLTPVNPAIGFLG